MDEFFTKWHLASLDQKKVYAAALGESVDFLERAYAQQYAEQLLSLGIVYPICIQFEHNIEYYSKKVTVQIKSIPFNFSFSRFGINDSNMVPSIPEEIILELYEDDYDNDTVKKILCKFDELRGDLAGTMFINVDNYFKLKDPFN